jgi:hypothetical protein
MNHAMKIFISHSSRDKWAARKIAQEIGTLKAETFLDEKDIETGESIDHSIKKHLKNSDHFLLLLSPASVKSEWVLIELGGALALGKTIIPILLYVGANEIPKAISLKLARDINDIEKYYDEVRQKIGIRIAKSAPSPIAKKQTTQTKTKQFKIGEKIKIAPQKPAILTSTGLKVGWVDSMDAYVGLPAKIMQTAIGPSSGVVVYLLDIDQGQHAWAEEWLVPDNS